MPSITLRDVDFTTARVHANHARMLEGARLDAMCKIRTLPELARQIWDDASPTITSSELQRRFVADYIAEIESLSQTVPEGVRPYFSILQEGRVVLDHSSLESDTKKTCEYYQKLLACAKDIPRPHNKAILDLVSHEAAIFLGMLALRLVFNYGFKLEAIQSYFFEGTALTRNVFEAVATQGELESALELCGSVLAFGSGPFKTIPELEGAAWDRYLKVAKRIWSSDPIGINAIIGYIGIRRIEVSNVVTLSEGLRLGVESSRLRSYLVPHPSHQEVRHV